MIEIDKVKQGVLALKKWNANYLEVSKVKNLLVDETENSVFLQVTLKKIPYEKSHRFIKILLPHLLAKDSTEVCLISGDLDKKDRKADIDPTILHYKEFLKGKGISQVTEVISLRQLRTEYKHAEAKHKLLAAYDVFLVDKRIAGCIPKLLGRNLFKKRKYPIQINMQSSNLKELVDKALSTTQLCVSGHGNSCAVEIAHLGLKTKQIMENIAEAVETIAKSISGGWPNILGLYLKTAKSISMPLYLSFDNPNDVVLKYSKVKEEVEAEELSTSMNKRVKVFSDGRIRVIVDEIKREEDVVDQLEDQETQQPKKKAIDDDDDHADIAELKTRSGKKKRQSIKIEEELCPIIIEPKEHRTRLSLKRKATHDVTPEKKLSRTKIIQPKLAAGYETAKFKVLSPSSQDESLQEFSVDSKVSRRKKLRSRLSMGNETPKRMKNVTERIKASQSFSVDSKIVKQKKLQSRLSMNDKTPKQKKRQSEGKSKLKRGE